MNIDDAILKRLDSVVAVQTLLGAGAAMRFHPLTLPEGTPLPAVQFDVVNSDRVHSHDGPSGLVFADYELVAWGRSLPEARNTAKAVRNALDGYQGTQAAPDLSSVYINSILFDEGGGGGYDYDDAQKRYGVAESCRVAFNELPAP